MPDNDGLKHQARAVVEKWSSKAMEQIEKNHGKKRFEGKDLKDLGYDPDEVTEA